MGRATPSLRLKAQYESLRWSEAKAQERESQERLAAVKRKEESALVNFRRALVGKRHLFCNRICSSKRLASRASVVGARMDDSN